MYGRVHALWRGAQGSTTRIAALMMLKACVYAYMYNALYITCACGKRIMQVSDLVLQLLPVLSKSCRLSGDGSEACCKVRQLAVQSELLLHG